MQALSQHAGLRDEILSWANLGLAAVPFGDALGTLIGCIYGRADKAAANRLLDCVRLVHGHMSSFKTEEVGLYATM